MVNCVIVQREEEWKGEMPKDGVYTPLRRIRASKKFVHSTANQKKNLVSQSKKIINENLIVIFLIVLPPLPGKDATSAICQSQR